MIDSGIDQFYADNLGLIHTVARKSYGRLMTIGASMDYEDLVQELSVVFLRSVEKFDQESGNKFSTYFTTAAFNHINRIAEAVELERIENGCRSVEEINAGAGDDPLSIEDTMPSFDATPEQNYLATETLAGMFNDLSPLAAMIAQITFDPPEEVVAEFEASKAHAEYARNLGVAKRCRSASLNANFVVDMLEKVTDLEPSRLKAAKRELMDMAERRLK